MDVLSGLRRRGYAIHLLALGEGPLLELAGAHRVEATRGPSLSFRHPPSIARAVRSVRRAVRATAPDVILASHAKGQVVTRLACAGISTPAQVTQLYDPFSPSISSRVAARLPGPRLAITTETATSWRAHNPRIHPEVIHPGVDVRRLIHESGRGDGGAAWGRAGFLGDGPRVLMVGRLQRFKGPVDFLEMAGIVLRAVPDARFLIVGPDSPIEPGLRGELEALIDARGMRGFVALAGRLTGADLAATMQTATLLVHPAKHEPFGLVLVESLALGTPVVAYASPGPEMIIDSRVGSLVPPGDVVGLADAVSTALASPERLRAWSDHALAAARRFDIERTVDRYAHAFEAAAKSRCDHGHVVTMIGAVPPGPSGVRDYGRILAAELRRRDTTVVEELSVNAGDRLALALGASTRQVWRAVTSSERGPVIWHYSPVVYGYRGIPLFGVLVGMVLRARGRRVVTVLHELAYTFRPGIDPPRAKVKERAQRLALRLVLAGSSATVVTTEPRAAHLARRGVTNARVVPVFATIPPTDRQTTGDGPFVVAVPAYAGDGVRPDILLDALPRLGAAGDVRVVLVGAPGPESDDGRRWTQLAEARGVRRQISFTGVVEPQDFSRRLCESTVVVLVNEEGPSARKTSLAGALALGLPVVSLDGYNRWDEVVDAGAVRLVRDDAEALGDVLLELYQEPGLRAELAELGAAFARRRMSVVHAADVFSELLQAAPVHSSPSGAGDARRT